jgi:hypothetical protein
MREGMQMVRRQIVYSKKPVDSKRLATGFTVNFRTSDGLGLVAKLVKSFGRIAEESESLDDFRYASLFPFGIACNFNGRARLLPSWVRKWLGRSLALPISPKRCLGQE